MTVDNTYTVIILDHSHCMLQYSNDLVDIDVIVKNKPVVPINKVNRTFWTNAVESTLEYMRIISDIFAYKKFISVVASDFTTAHLISDFSLSQQSPQKAMHMFGSVGRPDKSSAAVSGDWSLYLGLAKATRLLSAHSSSGKIICLTSFTEDAPLERAEKIVKELFNRITSDIEEGHTAGELLACLSVDFIHLHSVDSEPGMDVVPDHFVTPRLKMALYTTAGGKALCDTLLQLATRHYRLACTVVSGIPMKEEQQANTSANYDVELFHDVAAHKTILAENEDHSLLTGTSAGGHKCLFLRWLSPRAPEGDSIHCVGSYRLSPLDVNSRHSLCLTNFLLAGRSVILEIPRKATSPSQTHMMACHGGEIYLHILAQSRSNQDEVCAITETLGGRNSNYRINEMSELVQQTILKPLRDSLEPTSAERMKKLLDRQTRYWPITASSMLVNMLPFYLEGLTQVLSKETLSEQDYITCRDVIKSIASQEARGKPLQFINPSYKPPKSFEDQFHQLWSELETLVRASVDISPDHMRILQTLHKYKSGKAPRLSITISDDKEGKVEMRSPEASLPVIPGSSVESQSQGASRKRGASTQSTAAGCGTVEVSSTNSGFAAVLTTNLLAPENQHKSIYDIWNAEMVARHDAKRRPFAGELSSVNGRTELYKTLTTGTDSSTHKPTSDSAIITQ